jgi:hypothetical protein
MERLHHQLMNEESRCTDLERQLCKAHSDSLMWKTKCDEQRLTSDELMVNERYGRDRDIMLTQLNTHLHYCKTVRTFHVNEC